MGKTVGGWAADEGVLVTAATLKQGTTAKEAQAGGPASGPSTSTEPRGAQVGVRATGALAQAASPPFTCLCPRSEPRTSEVAPHWVKGPSCETYRVGSAGFFDGARSPAEALFTRGARPADGLVGDDLSFFCWMMGADDEPPPSPSAAGEQKYTCKCIEAMSRYAELNN